MKIGFLTYPHCPECGCGNWKNEQCEFAHMCYRETIIDKNAYIMLEGIPSEWVEPDKLKYPPEPMQIINLDSDFLKEVHSIFQDCGYGEIACKELGFVLANYFMDALVEAHKKMSLDTFTHIDSIEATQTSQRR